MNRVPACLILLVNLFVLSHLALEAKACTCGPQYSIYQEYQLASAVFVGKAIGKREVQAGRDTETIFEFSVIEAFKGDRKNF
jgi:hypothetical protein